LKVAHMRFLSNLRILGYILNQSLNQKISFFNYEVPFFVSQLVKL
jgi:hypothetical protein